jgi:hypothetical protein
MIRNREKIGKRTGFDKITNCNGKSPLEIKINIQDGFDKNGKIIIKDPRIVDPQINYNKNFRKQENPQYKEKYIPNPCYKSDGSGGRKYIKVFVSTIKTDNRGNIWKDLYGENGIIFKNGNTKISDIMSTLFALSGANNNPNFIDPKTYKPKLDETGMPNGNVDDIKVDEIFNNYLNSPLKQLKISRRKI